MGKYSSPYSLDHHAVSHSSSSSSDSSWSSLPDDLLGLILDKLSNNSVYDFIRCATVCNSWFRFCLQLDDKKKKNQQLPLLFIHRNHSKNPNLYNIMSKSSSPLNLPCVAKIYCGSSHGWLIFAETNKRMAFTLTLFNPFTAATIHLPPLIEKYYKIMKVVLSDDPSTNNYELLVLQFHGKLALFTSGRWIYDENYFDSFGYYNFKDDHIFHLNQKFYALISGKLGTIEIVDCYEEEDDTRGSYIRLEGSVISEIYSEPCCQSSYLAQSIRGTLLFVQRFCSYPLFRVYEIEEEDKRFIPTLMREGGEKGLEDQALFLGRYSQSVSVRASDFAGCKPNSIYFIGNNTYGPVQACVYTLGDQCINTLYEQQLRHPDLPPPIWIQPRPNLTPFLKL